MGKPRSEAQQAASLARRRPIFSLLGANLISSIGNSITTLALPWFVLVTTGSAAKVGITAGVMAIGGVLASVLGGPVVDRLGFRLGSVVSDGLCSLIEAAIPVLYLAGLLQFWELLLLAFLLLSVNTPGYSARYALIPSLAGRANMPIERANAAYQSIPRLAQIAGPLLAGVLIGIIGPAKVIFVDAGGYALSAAIVAVGVPAVAGIRTRIESGVSIHQAVAVKHHNSLAQAGARYFDELRAGLRFLRHNRLVLSMVLVATVTNLLDVPLVGVVLPVYVRQYFGSAASLGLIIGAWAAGAFLGTVSFGAVGRRLPRRLTFILSFVLSPIVIYLALITRPPLAILVIAGALAGLISGPINPLYATVIQQTTPPQLLGRVFGAIQSVSMAGIPIGTIVTGVAVQGLGVLWTIVGMGLIYLAVTLSMFLRPVLRQMDVQPTTS